MSSNPVVIRASQVTKSYRLWDSPQQRLISPLKQILGSWVPSRIKKPNGLPQGYHEFNALREVSFEIRKGEAWGFVGVNGSGKSTLLKIISGNLRPSAGTVEVEGKVAVLDYGSGVNGDFTGRENIYLKGVLLGLTQKQIDQRYENIVDFADIGEFMDQPVKTYSSGMCARLGFAIMMHVDADIMITDEALAVGDAFFVQKCMRHINSFLKRGTFLFVSHAINTVMSLCTHAVWLDHGRAVRVGKAKEVCQAYMNFIDRQNSENFLEENGAAVGSTLESDAGTNRQNDAGFGGPLAMPSRARRISLSAQDLAALNHYYAPQVVLDRKPPHRMVQIEIRESDDSAEDGLAREVGVGGGKIFSVTLTDDQNAVLPSVLGGEVVRLSIRAVAEKLIRRPILGFRLKNHLGLALIAENTFSVTRDQDFVLQPGEVITANFRFVMPLVAVGEYVIRAGFADGVEDNNALIDVRNDALLLRCLTSGARHGLVGIPMMGIDLSREQPPPNLRTQALTG